MWWHRHKEKTGTPETRVKLNDTSWLNREIKCPFCGKKYPLSRILYVVEDAVNGSEDKVFSSFCDNYHGCQNDSTKEKTRDSRWLVCPPCEWNKAVAKAAQPWNGIELGRELDFYKIDALFDGDYDPEAATIDSDAEQSSLTKKALRPHYILCPMCHCRLPEDIDKAKNVQIGLYGGKRSGKTAYMTMAAMKIITYLDAAVLDESEAYYDDLVTTAQEKIGGFTPTLTEKQVFPIVIRIKPPSPPKDPSSPEMDPFYLTFQDIAGEHAEAGGVSLINGTSFSASDAFLAIIDLNMFVTTPEKKQIDELTQQKSQTNDGIQKGEIDTRILQLGINTRKFGDIFGRIRIKSSMHDLKSVQIVFTKIDRWMKSDCSDEEKKFLKDADILKDHTTLLLKDGQIHTETLETVNENLTNLLNAYHPESANMLPRLVGTFTQAAEVPSAYCAVSSRNAGIEAAGGLEADRDTINVLDPIMNILRWMDLYPHTSGRRKGGKA